MTNPVLLLPVKEVIRSAWEKVRGSKKTFWAAIGLTILIGFIIGFISGLLSNVSDFLSGSINFIGQIVTMLLQIGMLYLGILRARDAPINYKLMFHSFNSAIALRIIGVYVLQFLIFLPLSILFVFLPIVIYGGEIGDALNAGVTLSNFLLISWFVLGILIAIYLAIRMVLSMGFVVDRGTNSWLAIKMSFKATRKNELRILAVMLFQVVVIILGAIPLMIGLIWALPFTLIIYGNVYKKLGGNLNGTITQL